jgi:hypothetical protein
MEKVFNQKSFHYFVWTPLGSRVDKFFPSTSRVSSLILFPSFATGVVDTSGKFTAGVNDTSGTSGKLPLVSLIPMVHLELQISPQILEKI